MAAIYSNGGNRWNILGFNFTKRDALSSVYKISMGYAQRSNEENIALQRLQILYTFVLCAEIATIFGPNVVGISARNTHAKV